MWRKLRVERTFDHFVVVEMLGVGGMGTVYKARDTRLERFVALKLLRRDLSAEQLKRSIAAGSAHRCRRESSRCDTGFLFRNGSRADLRRNGVGGSWQPRRSDGAANSVPEQLAFETGIQVARGLRARIRRGLIHRDVKPANIFFVDEHAAKIGDFGLASTRRNVGQSAVSSGEPRIMSRRS